MIQKLLKSVTTLKFSTDLDCYNCLRKREYKFPVGTVITRTDFGVFAKEPDGQDYQVKCNHCGTMGKLR